MLQLQIIIVVDMYLNAIFKNKILRNFFELNSSFTCDSTILRIPILYGKVNRL